MKSALEIPVGDSFEAVVCVGITAPFDINAPARLGVPLVVSSPHSGRDYPVAFLAASRLNLRQLRRSEDSFVEMLFAAAPGIGAHLLAARFPRAYVDVNREPFELDPDMFDAPLPDYVDITSKRAAAGLGTIARIVAANVEIYRERLSFVEVEHRIKALYMPFREALGQLIETTQRHFGCAVLLDCHSMPSGSLDRHVDIVLGDRHGTSAHADLVCAAYESLKSMGYSVVRNEPYAGGAITRRYGRPDAATHAIQVEINRALYMDEDTFQPLDGFEKLMQDMSNFISTLGYFSLRNISTLTRASAWALPN